MTNLSTMYKSIGLEDLAAAEEVVELTTEHVDALVEQEEALEQDNSDHLEHVDGFSDIVDDAESLASATNELESTLTVAQECLATGADSAVVGRFLGLSLRKAHVAIGLLSDESDAQEQVGGPEVPVGDSLELPEEGKGETVVEPTPVVAEDANGEAAPAPVVEEKSTEEKPADEVYATASVESITNNIKAGAVAAQAKAKELIAKLIKWVSDLMLSIGRTEKYLNDLSAALKGAKTQSEVITLLDSSAADAISGWVKKANEYKASRTVVPVTDDVEIASKLKDTRTPISTSGAQKHVTELLAIVRDLKELKGLAEHFKGAASNKDNSANVVHILTKLAHAAAVGGATALRLVNRDAKTIRKTFVKKVDAKKVEAGKPATA